MLLQCFLQQPQSLRPYAVQLLQLGSWHLRKLPSSVYPAAVKALVAGAPMLPGRPVPDCVMRWIVPLSARASRCHRQLLTGGRRADIRPPSSQGHPGRRRDEPRQLDREGLRPSATRRSSLVVTNLDDQTAAVALPARHAVVFHGCWPAGRRACKDARCDSCTAHAKGRPT